MIRDESISHLSEIYCIVAHSEAHMFLFTQVEVQIFVYKKT